jgi:aspartyl protease family protein
MHRTLVSGTIAFVVLALAVGRLTADDAKPAKSAKPAAKAVPVPADAKATLEAAGLKVTTAGVSLPEEVELGKSIRESAKQKKTMMAADREVYAAQRDVDALRAQINNLKVQSTNLSAELANVTDVASNNRIVGALNATRGQIEQLLEKTTEAADRLKEARKKASSIRDSYIEEVAPMRARADEVTEKWARLAADSSVTAALDAVNQALGTKFALKPSPGFVSNLKQLKTIEEAVSSEAIKLENETNSLWVNVTINGKHKKRMIVDSGATSISLPDKMARDMGIEVGKEGIPIRVGLADGSEVPATLIKLDSVRVGKFTVEDVQCCILGPEARDAPPLLGMSFLGQFKFEVDAQQAELKLVRVDSGEPAPKENPREKGRTAKKKK